MGAHHVQYTRDVSKPTSSITAGKRHERREVEDSSQQRANQGRPFEPAAEEEMGDRGVQQFPTGHR
jgi:hypothetical protein